MVVRNWYIFTGLVMLLAQAIALLVYVIPKQITDVSKNYRSNHFPWQILWIGRLILVAELLFIISLPLGVPRSLQLISLPPPNRASKVASISNKVPGFAAMIVLVLIYYVGSKPLEEE